MSDFGFMSSGFGDIGGNAYEENFRINITAMLSLFISKALEDSLKYIKICKRNAVTKKDLEMALKFQTLRFFQNPELENELDEMKEEIKAELNDEELEYSENEIDDAEEDSSEGEWEDIPEGETVDEDNILEGGTECEGDNNDSECKVIEVDSLEDGLNEILQQFTLDDSDADEFSRANLRETDVKDRNFVVDFHKCSDSWNSWQPENDMQKTLFNAIESMTAQF